MLKLLFDKTPPRIFSSFRTLSHQFRTKFSTKTYVETFRLTLFYFFTFVIISLFRFLFYLIFFFLAIFERIIKTNLKFHT